MDVVSSAAAKDPLYMQLNAAELSAISMKDSPNSNDRDAGFCSASSESEGGDDLAMEHNPTEEVEAKPMALVRNKRKSTEPSKVVESAVSLASPAASSSSCTAATGPLKKRIRYTSTADSAVVLTPPAQASPPPHSASSTSSSSSSTGSGSGVPVAAHMWDPSQGLPHERMPNPAHIFVRHPGVTTLHRVAYAGQPEQQEPLALVLKKPQQQPQQPPSLISATSTQPSSAELEVELATGSAPLKLPKKSSSSSSSPSATATASSPQKKPARATSHNLAEDVLLAEERDSAGCHSSKSSSSGIGAGALSRPQQRNYKNMTRERRIEANARERTRVHTISAAYETLRRAVPAYASSQKLSKLSVLRVACSYILTLSRMAGEDYSADQSAPSIAECIEAVTSTIQTEGKVKRKKDE